MDRGAFALACIYGGWHWVTLGRWKGGRIRVVDSYVEKDWFRAGIYDVDMYSLTPEGFDYWDWENDVLLIRPGNWQKNYEEWLPARTGCFGWPARPLQWHTVSKRLRMTT